MIATGTESLGEQFCLKAAVRVSGQQNSRGHSVCGERMKRRQEGAQAARAGSATSTHFITVQQAGAATLCLGWTGQLTAPHDPNE